MTTKAPEKSDSKPPDAPATGPGQTDERPRRGGRTASRDGDSPNGGTAARRRTGTRAPDARRAAQLAATQVLELTGRQPENIVSVARDEDGWQVGVEVVELHRIPDTADILAVYQVRLDARGQLLSCGREHRYHRASTEEG